MIECYDKDELEILATLVLIFFLFHQKHYPKFEVMLNKLEDKFKLIMDQRKLDKFPFSFEYFSVLLWEIKGMERQAKEKLHLLSNSIYKAILSRSKESTKEDLKVLSNRINFFWAFGDNLNEQYKLVNFELNRLYMKSKDYRCGYKVLKRLVDRFPNDVEILLRTAKYCHYIGRNKESKRYYELFMHINRSK